MSNKKVGKKEKSESTNIHDGFFIKTMKIKQNAVDFLKAAVPSEIVEHINLKKIEYEDTSYIKKNLCKNFSDLVIKTEIGGKKANIYFLLEHKSAPETKQKLFYQLLRYRYLMLEEDILNKRELRPVIPLVFYHGEKTWTIPKEFIELFEVPNAIKPYLLNFKYLLYKTKDPISELENQFANNAILLSSMIALKTAFDEDILTGLKEVIKILDEINPVENADYIEILLTYIVKNKKIDETTIQKIINDVGVKGEKIMQTVVDKWIEEGMKKGMKKGLKEGLKEGRKEGIEKKQKEIVLNMSSKKLSCTKISEYTGIPLAKVKKILKNSGKN